MLWLSVVCLLSSSSANPPHIIVFMADDAGWNDFGFTAGLYPLEEGVKNPSDYPHALTPSIDALAADGITMKHHYAYRSVSIFPSSIAMQTPSAHRYCSPSRASFLTGRLPYHAHEGNPGINSVGCTNLNYTMIPAKLATAGYVSYQIGKWVSDGAIGVRVRGAPVSIVFIRDVLSCSTKD
jgi:leishmanolysin-like peptidase